jgi:allophanate hydrolase
MVLHFLQHHEKKIAVCRCTPRCSNAVDFRTDTTSMLTDLPFDIASLHAAYADGLAPAEVLAEAQRRLAAVDDPGIFLHLTGAAALADQLGALGPFDPVAKPLWGIPFAIKDNIDAAGAPTTAACPDYAYEVREDAFVLAQLRAAGAVLVGKTNLDQFATGLVGVRTPYPVPKNAIDPAIVPGGSSSGSAVAVAHGLVSFSLGTDTAGSGRVPAALNGIVGLKPTLGTISATGVVPACRTLDTVSVFALTVDDAWRVFHVAARFDPTDAYARPIPVPAQPCATPAIRIGVPDAATRKFFGDTVQAASYAATVDTLSGLGATITEIDFTPLYQIAELLYEGAWVAERYSVIESLLKTRPEALLPVTRAIIGKAEQFSSADVFRGLYRLKALLRDAEAAISGVDALCVPSIPGFCTVAELEADPVGPNSRLGTYTNFVNLMDLCALTVPVARRSDGRPGSVTLIGPCGQDARLAGLGSVLQRHFGVSPGATGWPLPQRAAPAPAPAPGADEIAVAAVGAHMSGLPLNHELTRLGARFLRAARTAPNYRLYRLAGGPPYRPGLVRSAAGEAIEIEVWAVPLDRFGEFMQGIPQPLGIGTLDLDDGSQVKGFVCEAIGTEGAEDVSRFGGWRAYLAAAAN